MSGKLYFLECIFVMFSCRNHNFFWRVHFEWTYSLVPSWAYCSSGVGLGLLVRFEKLFFERGSQLVCVVRDKTRICWEIVGWAPTQGSQNVAHFYTVTTVTKTHTDAFSRFLVLNASWHVLDTHKNPGGNPVRISTQWMAVVIWEASTFKGGPEPLENEINRILSSKREDRFSDHFFDLVQNICTVRFLYLLRPSNFCKAPRDMRKFPQQCQKIAGCWGSAVYGSRPLPDSSPPKRPGLDNFMSQPWSDTTCPCTTSANDYLRFVTILLLEKTRQSTRSGGTGVSCVRPWLARDIV